MKKLVYGVGVNDADYVVCPKINGKQRMCKFYMTWLRMMERGYSKKLKEKFPTYASCSVCDEWHSFMEFKRWMKEQDWDGKSLDKDLILSGNKIYSPETCIFVSRKINAITTTRGALRGKWPLGVCFCFVKNKHQSSCRINGNLKNLGYFNSAHAAHREWQRFKIKVIGGYISEQSDKRLIDALDRMAKKIQLDYDLNIETTHC